MYPKKNLLAPTSRYNVAVTVRKAISGDPDKYTSAEASPGGSEKVTP